MRKTKVLRLALIPVLLSGCGIDSPDAMQRDVYTKFEDCVADWGKPELCQQMQDADARHHAAQTTGVQGGGGSHVIFWGPSYYPDARAVTYNGQSYSPTSNRGMSRPFVVSRSSSMAARSSPATPHSSSVARGGFGGGGRAAAAASSGG